MQFHLALIIIKALLTIVLHNPNKIDVINVVLDTTQSILTQLILDILLTVFPVVITVLSTSKHQQDNIALNVSHLTLHLTKVMASSMIAQLPPAVLIMQTIFNSATNIMQDLLLIDANNAFKLLQYQMMLHNITDLYLIHKISFNV